MKIKRRTPSKLTLILLAAIGFFFLYKNNRSGQQIAAPTYYSANSHYQDGDYRLALEEFYQVLKVQPGLVSQDPLLNFKIGYALYRTEKWRNAVEAFNNGRFPEIIEDYRLYFQALSFLQLGDTASARIKIAKLRGQFPKSPLFAKTDSLRARLALDGGEPDSAYVYLRSMLGSGKFEKTEVYLQIMDILTVRHDIDALKEYAFRFIRIYPFHNRTENVYNILLGQYGGKIPKNELENLLDYLFTTRQYLAAEDLIGRQRKYAGNRFETDYFNCCRWRFHTGRANTGGYSTGASPSGEILNRPGFCVKLICTSPAAICGWERPTNP